MSDSNVWKDIASGYSKWNGKENQLNSLGNIATTLGAVGSIYGSAADLAQLKDTTGLQDEANSISGTGANGFGSINDISAAYASLSSFDPSVSKKDVYDPDWVSGYGSAIASGAGALYKASGGNWLAAGIGAGVGALGAGIGNIIGNDRANKEVDKLNKQRAQALQDGYTRAATATDSMMQANFNNAYKNRKAEGGDVDRNISLTDFAKVVLSRKRDNDVTRSLGIIRERREGGLVIRIKK